MKKKIVIGICVGVLVVALIAAAIVKNSGSAGSGPVFSVNVAEIVNDDISSTISANGTVTEVEKSEVYLDTPVKVTKLYIKQNDIVKKGQQLLQFDFDTLNMQLEQAKIKKRTDELTLQKLKLTDPALSVSSAQNSHKLAENSVASAQRALDNAVKAFEDNKVLYGMDAISKSELDASENKVKDAEEALKSAQLKLQAENDNVSSAHKSKSTKQIDIESQELVVKNSELTVMDLESKIKKYTDAMYAAMDGVASQVNVNEAAFTPNGQTVYTVVNPNKLEVKLNINEYSSKLIKPGQTVDITGDSIPEKEKVTGKVKSISPVASKNTNNSGSQETVIQVIVSIDNITEAIKPGISVDCDIKTVDLKSIPTIQLDMLSPDKDGNNFVYIVDKDKMTMRKVPVEIGNTSDMKAEIKTGEVKVGDFVVVGPKATFKDGARVKLVGE